MSRQVDSTRQGELQGVMASVNSLTTIIGPLVGTGIYAATRLNASGTVWFVGVALYLLVIPILMGYRRLTGLPVGHPQRPAFVADWLQPDSALAPVNRFRWTFRLR
jgi:DHA1 family tetracycline resistance protein-like MFS transporter